MGPRESERLLRQRAAEWLRRFQRLRLPAPSRSGARSGSPIPYTAISFTSYAPYSSQGQAVLWLHQVAPFLRYGLKI